MSTQLLKELLAILTLNPKVHIEYCFRVYLLAKSASGGLVVAILVISQARAKTPLDVSAQIADGQF